jgi:dTDP-4-dehydrorhamnose reductase
MKVIVIGASGMLGHVMVSLLSKNPSLEVTGTVRSLSSIQRLAPPMRDRCQILLDVESQDQLIGFFATHKPDVVVNCVGLVKQLASAEDPLSALPINALLPHRLAQLCSFTGARLIHISTDCVFSGQRGGYKQSDTPDASDLYGRSKLLGEVDDSHAITLRTSIIGHELSGAKSLIGWFLAKDQGVKGYARAIFSGLPTCELARVVRDFVLPTPTLQGLYHVAALPISKYELLCLVNQEYGKNLFIERNDQLKIDRSLDASRFQNATGYVAPAWPQLIAQMRAFHLEGLYV